MAFIYVHRELADHERSQFQVSPSVAEVSGCDVVSADDIKRELAIIVIIMLKLT